MSTCPEPSPHRIGRYARLAAILIAVGSLGLPAIALAQLPTVTIAATDASASEIGPDTGTFTITRTGSTTALLSVFFTISGTATNNGDYTFINSSVNIPAGQPSVPVVITPVNDAFVEAPRR